MCNALINTNSPLSMKEQVKYYRSMRVEKSNSLTATRAFHIHVSTWILAAIRFTLEFKVYFKPWKPFYCLLVNSDLLIILQTDDTKFFYQLITTKFEKNVTFGLVIWWTKITAQLVLDRSKCMKIMGTHWSATVLLQCFKNSRQILSRHIVQLNTHI